MEKSWKEVYQIFNSDYLWVIELWVIFIVFIIQFYICYFFAVNI